MTGRNGKERSGKRKKKRNEKTRRFINGISDIYRCNG